MKNILIDLFFLMGIILMFIPLFRLSKDLAIFLAGCYCVYNAVNLSKKRGDKK